MSVSSHCRCKKKRFQSSISFLGTEQTLFRPPPGCNAYHIVAVKLQKFGLYTALPLVQFNMFNCLLLKSPMSSILYGPNRVFERIWDGPIFWLQKTQQHLLLPKTTVLAIKSTCLAGSSPECLLNKQTRIIGGQNSQKCLLKSTCLLAN